MQSAGKMRRTILLSLTILLVLLAVLCPVVKAGETVGWSYDRYGQAKPPVVRNNYIAISAGSEHSLALKSNGFIVGWGRNDYGQAAPPVRNNFVAITAGGYHSLALRSDGSIVGWGNNVSGQANPPAENDFIAIAAGEWHSLALKSDGSIVGWGYNEYGQVNTPEGNDFIAIAAGGEHSLALKSDGSIVGWGDDEYSQATSPDGNDFTVIAAGGYHSLALISDGNIVGWGGNWYGQATPPDGNDFNRNRGYNRHTFRKYSKNPIFVASEPWEGTVVTESAVLHEGGTFKMWYRGNTGRASAIGYAESPDMITWTKYASNPILSAPGGIAYPFIVKVDSTYYLYAVKMSAPSLFRWSSADGINWNIDNGGNPVLTAGVGCGAVCEWEDTYITNPSVLYEPGGKYPWKMLYEARGDHYLIGYAYSTDGLNWTKYAKNPVIPAVPGTWKSGQTHNASPIIKIDLTYYTWHTGCGANGWTIGLGSSRDFINWTDYYGNPQIFSEFAWEADIVTDPDILEVSGEKHKVYLTYTGDQNAIGLAYLDEPISSFVSSQRSIAPPYTKLK